MKRAWANPKKGQKSVFCEIQTYKLMFKNLLLIATYEIDTWNHCPSEKRVIVSCAHKKDTSEKFYLGFDPSKTGP